MWVVIILFMCCQNDTVTCSQMLYKRLLYGILFVVSVIQTYVALCFVNGYYIFHVVTSMQLCTANKIFIIALW
jgi:hypothetical protein